MAQEFVVNSTTIENKINQLLPSQGGFGAGVDFTASTMVIPIVDITESAEGSGLRQDLQSSLTLASTAYNVIGATNTTIINTTGYFRFYGLMSCVQGGASATVNINITDGTTTKNLLNGAQAVEFSGVGLVNPISYDFIVKIKAGESVRASASDSQTRVSGVAVQIADINGNLT